MKTIVDREEPTFDIRNVFPDVNDEITIIGNIASVMTELQFKYLKDHNMVREFGFDGQTSYIKISNLFSLDDIKSKIEKIMPKE